jgi:nitronate monooxygenase
MQRDFCRLHGLSVPVVLAPMAGGPSTPELAAAVSEAGGLGSLALAYLSLAQTEQAIIQTQRLTKRPFAVNFFAPESNQPLSGDLEPAKAFLAPLHSQLGIAPPESPSASAEIFEQQVDLVLTLRVPCVSFTMGIPSPSIIQKFRAQDVYLMATATTVDEAQRIESGGFDAVLAQGSEAGGHRGTFAGREESALVGTIALTPQVVDAVSIPVIASGGIMDGRGIVAALALGAQAAQMGTAFLCCDEAGTGRAYRQALLKAREDQTALTRAFSGRLARGVRNQFIDQAEASAMKPLSFPWQNTLTRPLRQAARAAENAGLQSLWAGQGLRMLRNQTAAQLMERLKYEIVACRERISWPSVSAG